MNNLDLDLNIKDGVNQSEWLSKLHNNLQTDACSYDLLKDKIKIWLNNLPYNSQTKYKLAIQRSGLTEDAFGKLFLAKVLKVIRLVNMNLERVLFDPEYNKLNILYDHLDHFLIDVNSTNNLVTAFQAQGFTTNNKNTYGAQGLALIKQNNTKKPVFLMTNDVYTNDKTRFDIAVLPNQITHFLREDDVPYMMGAHGNNTSFDLSNKLMYGYWWYYGELFNEVIKCLRDANNWPIELPQLLFYNYNDFFHFLGPNYVLNYTIDHINDEQRVSTRILINNQGVDVFGYKAKTMLLIPNNLNDQSLHTSKLLFKPEPQVLTLDEEFGDDCDEQTVTTQAMYRDEDDDWPLTTKKTNQEKKLQY